MKTTHIFIICFLILTGNYLLAQTRFVTDGIVEYEKSINSFAVIKRQVEATNYTYSVQMFEQFKKTQPQFKTLKSTLSFSKDKTLFEPVPVTDAKYINFVSGNPAFEQNNTIYTDLSANNMVSQKVVFEQTFLLKDNPRKINWKITDETREIAGYSCRRANGIMLDSIYVVAFYAEAIPISGGPESFSGLPGMILGVALPHENVTWFATKVNDKTVPPLKVPTKGKAISSKDLKGTLESALKNWGKEMPIYLKAFML